MSRSWLKSFFLARYPGVGVPHHLAHKTVPVHRHTLWYYCGGMTLSLIGLQIATGLLLLLYYRPSMEGAFESIRFIMTKVEFGWLIRSIHVWAANLAILSAVVHLASTFFMKAYRPPRELTWVSGVLLFFLLMGFGFTGYLLPWNTVSFFATKVGTEIAGNVPVVGAAMQNFLLGGPEVGEATLSRFYWFHIVVLPLGLAAVLGAHLWMVQLQGMSKPLSVRGDRSMRFLPDFLLRDAVAWAILLGAVLALSVHLPAHLGEKADMFAPTPPGIMPEWYFLWMFQTLKLFPGHVMGFEGEQVAVIATSLPAVVLLLLPWIDRPAARGRSHWVFWVAGVIGMVYVAVMTAYALCAQPPH